MKRDTLYSFFLFSLIIIVITGCNVTRNLESNEFLLIKNKIKVPGNKVPVEDLLPYIQQHPNGMFLNMFRLNIALYNIGSKGEETKFKKWLKTKPGEAPVLIDTSLISASAKQMQLYLANRGYFNSTVTDSVIYKKKKAKVIYIVHPNEPYRIRKLTYSIADTQLARFVFKDTLQSLIKRGNNYDSYVFDDERTRITQNLLNSGYFRFSTNFIKFSIDTNLRSRQLDLILEVVNEVVPSMADFSRLVMKPHKRYFVNKIYIYPEYDHVNPYKGSYDTVAKFYENPFKGQASTTYYFLNYTNFKIKPRTITQSVFITPKSFYNLKDVNQTYSQLSGLQVFKYINLQFRDCPPAERRPEPGKDMIDCHLELSRKPVHSFAITTDGTNSSGALGVQANVGYQNYNIFRGAQLLRINVNSSLQMQATDGSAGKSFFNTIEFGANAGLTFPQFLLPVKPEKLPKNFKPKTIVSIGYNYQLQEHYNRHISNISFGYSWKQKVQFQHLLNPVEISLVKIFKDAYFDSVLESQQDNRLKNQYTDHLVAGLKYTFTYNSQQINKSKNFIYLRSNFETGGNLLYVANEIFGGNWSSENPYQLFGLPFAQFIRPDVDFRFFNVRGNNFSVVYRIYGGIGIPYGNVNNLPFEKTFFAGGANGMRGWKMYTLGPGTYNNAESTSTFNQIGDIQLEGNIEYRFPIYDWIRGALFVDAGNIWLLKESPDLPGGKFEFSNFLGEIAVDAGIGLRFDFDFFIFRFDPAIPLKNPAYPENNRWTFNKLQVKDIVWNFGIGYPF
jgi:outer membrane protein assembly factor BamA